MKKWFTLLGLVSVTALSNAQIVINEIYTGGGLLGALITNDFIELKNIGASTATLSNATIQYGPISGPFTQYHELPPITLGAGQTYLIQQASDGLGLINLVNPNLIVNVVLNFDGSGPLVGVGLGLGLTSGKVALASNAVQVTGPGASNVLDFVGYGLADQYEGSGAAPSPTILNSITRTGTDTNSNAVDFTISTPTPQNGVLGVSNIGVHQQAGSFIKNTLVTDGQLWLAADVADVKVYSSTGRLVKTTASPGRSVNISELTPGTYIVTGQVKAEPVSAKILKK